MLGTLLPMLMVAVLHGCSSINLFNATYSAVFSSFALLNLN